MLQELISEDKRRIYELEQQLLEIERGKSTTQLSDVNLVLGEMAGRLDDLEAMANKEAKGRRDDMRRHISHLRTSHARVGKNLESLNRRLNLRHPEALFSSSSRGDPDRDLEGQMSENISLVRSQGMVESYLEIGRDTLSELLGQKERLKSAQRKVFDIANYLGLSNSIMKTVEGRDAADKWITYIGMFLILLLLFVIWWWRS
jgi:golgi SNAP receptor complex member 2